MDITTLGVALSYAKNVAKPTDEQITTAVDAWLDDHPEATTTVEDGSITRAKLNSSLQETVDGASEIVSEMPEVIGKNKYDKITCNPENGYTYKSGTGVKTAGNNYAVSGKIPVEAETQYAFSTTEFSKTYSKICFFGGADGSTYLGITDTYGLTVITTPANCTYIGINLFGRSHTADDFAAAINALQVELGGTPTSYEAYSKKRMLSPDYIVDGEAVSAAAAVTFEQSQINLYDKTMAVNGKYYNSSGGANTSADWAITGLIPVEPNTQYNISRDPSAPMELGGSVKMYGADLSFIGNATLGNYVYSTLYAFVTGTNVRFIGVSLKKTGHTTQEFNDTIDSLMLCRGTMRPLEYAAYNPEAVVNARKLNNAYADNTSRFDRKTWMALGTSITWYDGKAYEVGIHAGELCRGYVGNVSRRKPLLINNQGINGATLGDINSNSLINRYTNLDWEHTDIATLEFGVNDLGNSVPVGTAEDAAGTTTFAACLKTVIRYALSENPQICLVICTEPDVRGTNTNNNGNTLKDYTDVTLAIAAQYRLPVCDWYYHSGINALNKGDQTKEWMTVDGTHPSDVGHNRMAAMLNQVFDSLIC